MSDSKPGHGPPGPDDPAYYAPRRLRDIGSAADQNWPTPAEEYRPQVPAQQVPAPTFRPTRDGDGRAQDRSDFNDAVAKMLREQLEAENARAGFALARRTPFRVWAPFAVGLATAGGLVTLTYLTIFAPSPQLSGDRLWAALKSLQAIKSVPAPARSVSTLFVRNQSGLVNEPLGLGVSVGEPRPGATVAIKGLPHDVRLTAGTRTSAAEWRVRADEVLDARVVPPADFVGDVNVAVELYDSDGAALVTSYLQLSWKPQPVTQAVALSTAAVPQVAPVAAAPAVAPVAVAPVQPSVPARPQPQPPTQVASIPQTTEAPASPAPADHAAELTPNEIAISIRRAQELLATGDVKAARALLQRAAEAHDARAALALAKTYDPIVSRQSGVTDRGGPDPAQARNWYQKARDWGSPDAQRLLDALASYQR